jgi:hypothetical protein
MKNAVRAKDRLPQAINPTPSVFVAGMRALVRAERSETGEASQRQIAAGDQSHPYLKEIWTFSKPPAYGETQTNQYHEDRAAFLIADLCIDGMFAGSPPSF